MKLTPRFMAIVVFVVLFGGIMLSAALGQWVTTTTKEPMTFKEGEFAGQYNPADIRGSYTFGDISRLFGIPLEDLAFAFRLTEGDPALVRLGTLEDKLADMGVDLGTSSVRLFTALYAGLPFDLSLQDSYLLPEAVAILKEKANLTAEQSAYLDTHTADEAALVPAPQAGITDAAPTPGLRPQGSGGGSGIPIAGYTPEAYSVVGKTTFQDLLDWGVRQEDIENVIGTDMPLASIVIKDWVTSQGLSFPTIKAQLQALADAAK